MKRFIKIAVIVLFLVSVFVPINAHVDDLKSEYGNIKNSDELKFVLSYPEDKYYGYNCAPIALANVYQMINYPFISVEDIRLQIRDKSGGVYSNEIESYLSKEYFKNGLDYTIENGYTQSQLNELLSKGNVLVVSVDLNKLTKSKTPYLDCFNLGYSYSSLPNERTAGHTFVLLDRYIIDEISYYAVLDTNNTCIRLYNAAEVVDGIANIRWRENVYCFDISRGISLNSYEKAFVWKNLFSLVNEIADKNK